MVVVGFAVFVDSLFNYEVVNVAELGIVDVCISAADAAPVRRESPPPRPPPRAAATISTRTIAPNAQNALLLRLLMCRLGVSCNLGSDCCDPEPERTAGGLDLE